LCHSVTLIEFNFWAKDFKAKQKKGNGVNENWEWELLLEFRW